MSTRQYRTHQSDNLLIHLWRMGWPWHLLLLGLALSVSYGHTLDVPFYLDDFSSIKENPRIYNQEGLGSLWQYAPLRILGYLSFSWNYAWHQFDATGYHLFNLLVHFFAACAVYALGAGLLRSPGLRKRVGERELAWLPLLAALLFLLHPLHIQAVTYVVQRLASLAALFYLASLACFVQARLSGQNTWRWTWLAACLLFALLGFFTKQNTATLPLALLLIEVLFFRASWRRLLLAGGLALLGLFLAWVLLALVFNYSPFSLSAMQALTRDTTEISRSAYLATQSVVLWIYMKLLVWPVGLRVDYDFALMASFFDWRVMLALLGHLALISLALFMARRQPLIAFGILFYYLAHSVESSVIPIRDVVFEHRAYLPDTGPLLIFAWLLSKYLPPLTGRWPAVGLIALLLLSLTAITWQRNDLWRDPIALWRDNTEKAPQNPRGWSILGKHYLQSQRIEEGITALQEAIRLQREATGQVSAVDMVNLIVGLKHQQRYREALGLTEDMLNTENIAPILRAKFLINQGNIYVAIRRDREAETAYRQAIKEYPPGILARANLANLLARQGRLAEAERLYQQVVAINPNNPTLQQNLEKIRAMRQRYSP